VLLVTTRAGPVGSAQHPQERRCAHLSGCVVAADTRVKLGELIAYNGQSGDARFTAPHIHFKVHPVSHVRPACG
jgi:murein DD-endopeptidase MepM/ murein hydrolase activator NlpD